MINEFEFYVRQCLERCRENQTQARKNLEIHATGGQMPALIGLLMQIQSSGHEELVLLRVLQNYQDRLKENPQ